jgi:uroporphyrinogen decarboxylase
MRALAAEPVDRPPVWLMRQAGRTLPEYRALKEKYTFLELVQTPELAAEVTLQPVRRFGFDAAVIFSDILIAAEAMGQGYRFREGGGIAMDFAIQSAADVDRLRPEQVGERLAYLADALRLARAELGEETALLGFAGSPWTLANYMLEGGSREQPLRAKQLFYSDRRLFDRLLGAITEAVIALFRLQAAAGADALQLFDTYAELLAADTYAEASGQWIRRIAQALGPGTPLLLYVRGAPAALPALADSGLRGFSVDWRMDLPALRRQLPPGVVLQGNLDPALMLTEPEVVRQATRRMLTAMQHARGYIVNLGHGLPPGAALENIGALAATVKASASTCP